MKKLVDEKHFANKHKLYLHKTIFWSGDENKEIEIRFWSHRPINFCSWEEIMPVLLKWTGDDEYGWRTFFPGYACDDNNGSDGIACVYFNHAYPTQIAASYIKREEKVLIDYEEDPEAYFEDEVAWEM